MHALNTELPLYLGLQINEDLIWLVFLALWGIYSLFFAKKKKPELTPEEEEEAARKAREIQEEIRRRIAERLQRPGGPVAEEYPTFQTPPEREVHSPAQQEAPVVVEAPLHGESNWLSRLEQAQREQSMLEARAAEARQRAESVAKRGAARSAPVQAGPVIAGGRQGIVAALNQKDGLRQAVLLAEVLQPPVSERRGGTCAGW